MIKHLSSLFLFLSISASSKSSCIYTGGFEIFLSVEPSVLFYGPVSQDALAFFSTHFFNPGNLVKWRGMVPSVACSPETEASCCQSARKILYVTKSVTVIKGANCPKTPPFFTQGTGVGQSLCVYV